MCGVTVATFVVAPGNNHIVNLYLLSASQFDLNAASHWTIAFLEYQSSCTVRYYFARLLFNELAPACAVFQRFHR